jgi:hypothetical protein
LTLNRRRSIRAVPLPLRARCCAPAPARIFQPNRAFVTEDEPVAARTLRLMISRPIDGGLHEDIDITNNGQNLDALNDEAARGAAV